MTVPFHEADRFFADNGGRCRVIEVHRDHYEITFWPKSKPPPELFDLTVKTSDALQAETLAELATPPQFTYVTDPLHCEHMAGIRSRPANPNRKPTPKMLEYLRRFKHPEADKLTFDQAQAYLDHRFGAKEKQGEMKIVVARSDASL